MAAKPDDAGAEEVEEPALESVPEKAGPLLSLLGMCALCGHVDPVCSLIT